MTNYPAPHPAGRPGRGGRCCRALPVIARKYKKHLIRCQEWQPNAILFPRPGHFSRENPHFLHLELRFQRKWPRKHHLLRRRMHRCRGTREKRNRVGKEKSFHSNTVSLFFWKRVFPRENPIPGRKIGRILTKSSGNAVPICTSRRRNQNGATFPEEMSQNPPSFSPTTRAL